MTEGRHTSRCRNPSPSRVRRSGRPLRRSMRKGWARCCQRREKRRNDAGHRGSEAPGDSDLPVGMAVERRRRRRGMAIRPEREGVSCGATVCCPFMVLCARLKSGVPSRGTLCKFMKTSKTTLCPWPAIRATLQSPRASRRRSAPVSPPSAASWAAAQRSAKSSLRPLSPSEATSLSSLWLPHRPEARHESATMKSSTRSRAPCSP